MVVVFFFFSSRRRHTRFDCDWSSDVCSSDLTYWRQLRTRDGLLRAIEAFEEALAVDSAYAPAYAGLSSVLSLFVLYQYSGGPEPVSALARAIVLADRAIALDPSLAEGFAARGWALTNAGVSVDTAGPGPAAGGAPPPHFVPARTLF